ncbi:tetratricopeptide repeat protein [bacterium]|nr:tetratricopeptide repeat protein [bacterium]
MTDNSLILYDKKILNFIEAGDYKHTLWVAEESYVFSKTLFGDTHLETAKTLNNLAGVYDLLQRYDVAETFYLRSVGLKKTIYETSSVELIPTLENLMSLYLYQEKFRKAEKILYDLIEIAENKKAPWIFRKAVYLCQLADLYERQWHTARAADYYHKCAAFVESVMPFDHPNLGRVFANIADHYARVEKYPRAQFYYQRAYSILSKILSKRHSDVKHVIDGMNFIRSYLPDSQTTQGQ